ncbi:hypothetical protein JL37_28330 [Achromobacter sp. RTa]|uniref:hypothetical protein n=1 Tax=Achromobacter sp. RTa TaxID=1532557 RepID=UPI0005103336|nr:hypothetical protein [Achromobacter sp. RTa]KGD86820.1 hypothetical protein JL37_28330 [Achromobacter sp. RTa]
MVQLSSFLSASVQGGRVQLDDTATNAQGRGMFGRLKDRIVQGSEQVKESNHRANSVFAQALAREYGYKAAAAAVDRVIGRDYTATLNKTKIDKMISVAQGLSGVGKARDQARNVCLNSWPRVSSGFNIQRTGHSAVAISNTMSPNSWSHAKEYVSWWPAKSDVEVSRNRALEMLPGVGGHFEARPGMSAPSYDSDRGDEISEKTNLNLQRGQAARDVLKTAARLERAGDKDPLGATRQEHAEELGELGFDEDVTLQDLQAAARFFPRDSQELVSGRTWGAGAEKVFFPLAGRNGEHGSGGLQPRTTLFGLAEHDMLADANQLKADAEQGLIGYSKLSTTQNCAAVAARSLQAGGSNIYVPFEAAWITEDPNKTYAYALQLQAAIDQLNDQAGSVKAHCAAAWSKAPAEADAISILRATLLVRADDLDAYDQTRQQAQGVAADQRILGLSADVAHAKGRVQEMEQELAGLETKIVATQKEVNGRSEKVRLAADSLAARAARLQPDDAKAAAKLNADRKSHQKDLAALELRRGELATQLALKPRLEQRILALDEDHEALSDLLEDRKAFPVEAAQLRPAGEEGYYAAQRRGLQSCVEGLADQFDAHIQGLDARQQRQLAPLGRAVSELRDAVNAGGGMQALLSKAKPLVETLHALTSGAPAADQIAILAAGSLVEACEILITLDQDRRA